MERIRKSRASTSEAARKYRQDGHDDALKFAQAIGLDIDYQNDHIAKKDVVDKSGDTHSVKSGKKKWQIFLYGVNRFKNDNSFRAMNGIGDILINCINSFPNERSVYENDKSKYKEILATNMVTLAEKLQEKYRLSAFINKSMFNGGEVNYLTIYENNKFHVFWGKEVEKLMSEKLEVTNSIARTAGQYSNQKVLLRYKGVNLGEIEMRNDSDVHYREVRFNMYKAKVVNLLFENILTKTAYNEDVIMYGEAIKKFGKWK